MTTLAGAHFDGFGEASPLDLDLSPRMAAQLLDRVKDGTFDAFATAAAHVGHCAHPIRLSGSTTRIDAHTGEVLSVFRSTDQPLGVLFQRCGNRRESVCPSCSRLYARDTFEVIRCGVQGGKNIPDTVADNPLVFLTLTAPSFGAVHGTRGGKPCHPRREGQLCPHGKPQWCNLRHDENDTLLGQPICPDCYRYGHHLMWQWWAPELWRRFTITLRRHLAGVLGVSPSKLNDSCSVQFAKVAEMQTRGAIHFHALIRLDGPVAQGIGAPAPAGITSEVLAQIARDAAAAVSYVAPAPHPSIRPMLLVFGAQVDAKPVRTSHRPDDPDRELQPAQVAGYLAKYATKDATAGTHGTTNPHLDRLVALCRAWSGHARGRDNLRRTGHHVPQPVGKDGLDVYTAATPSPSAPSAGPVPASRSSWQTSTTAATSTGTASTCSPTRTTTPPWSCATGPTTAPDGTPPPTKHSPSQPPPAPASTTSGRPHARTPTPTPRRTEPMSKTDTLPGLDTTPRLETAFDYLTSDELAVWLRVSPSTLCRWRKTGQGPRCTWLSSTCPRYLRADVEAWLRRAAA